MKNVEIPGLQPREDVKRREQIVALLRDVAWAGLILALVLLAVGSTGLLDF